MISEGEIIFKKREKYIFLPENNVHHKLQTAYSVI